MAWLPLMPQPSLLVAMNTALGLSGPLLLDPLSKFGVRTRTEASQFCPVRIKGSSLHQARVGCGEWRSWCCLGPVLCWSFEQSVSCWERLYIHLSKAARILNFAQVVRAGGGSGAWGHTAIGGSCHPPSLEPDVLSCNTTHRGGENRHQ